MHQVGYTPRERLATLRWALPLTFIGLVFLYQLGPARWVHDNFSDPVHFAVEILFYATAGPLLTYWTLTRVSRWLEAKEAAERQARASERRLASITNASADAILGLDQHKHLESWNRGAELLFGYAAEETLGQPLTILFESQAAAELEISWLDEAVQRSGFVRGHETVCRQADGRSVDVELTATGLHGERGEPVGMSIIMRDISNRKQREDEIRRLNASLNQQVAERTQELAEKVKELAQANAELQKLDQMRSELVSLVSHQIRAPLTNVRGAVERMQADCTMANATCWRMFSILDEQVLRLDRLVEGVLNAARLETGQLALHQEPISVMPVVAQVTEQMGVRHSERTISLGDKPGLPLVYADRDRVAEVLVNLLDNADKYSPPDAPVSVDVQANETEVTISVRDSGPGLSEEALERVFDRFYRVDGGDSQAAYGYGLGLYVCRRLVEAQGGRIWAENRPGKGALFAFTLPVWSGANG